MKYKILQLDANGRISFSKEELEKLLDEVYDEGYQDGRKTCQYPYWTYPSWKPGDIWVNTDGTNSKPNDYKIHVGDFPGDTTGVNYTTTTSAGEYKGPKITVTG